MKTLSAVLGLVLFVTVSTVWAATKDEAHAACLQGCANIAGVGGPPWECDDKPLVPLPAGDKDAGEWDCYLTGGPHPGLYAELVYEDPITCTAGDNSSGNFRSSSLLDDGGTFCNGGCKATFHQPPTGYVGACDNTTPGPKACVNVGQATNTGEKCSPGGSDPPDPPDHQNPPKVCDPNSGVCVQPGQPPMFCANGGAGPCVPAGGCGAGSTDTLCASPPNGNPPTPPQPPIPNGQPPISVTNFSTNTSTTTNNYTTNNYQNPPPTETPGVCADGSTPGNGGQCSNGQPATCPAGTTMADGKCNGGPVSGGTTPGKCPGGGEPNVVTGKCPDGTGPTCPDGSTPNSSGQCPAGNGNGDPTTCGGSGKLVNGTCYCPSGTTYNGANCVGAGGSGNGNGDPGKTGNGTCDGPSPPPECKDVANGGGDCGAAPSCSGDTVLCNIDFQAWQQRCESIPGTSDDQAYLAGQPQDGSSAFTEQTIDDTQFDSTGFLGGGGACVNFDPLQVAFGGHTASVNFNNPSWCMFEGLLGAIILGFAYYRAARILMGANI